MEKTVTAERVGREVRAQMVRANVRQGALAEKLRLSQAAVSRRLTGEVPFDVNELTAVAELLAVPMSTLLAEPVPA